MENGNDVGRYPCITVHVVSPTIEQSLDVHTYFRSSRATMRRAWGRCMWRKEGKRKIKKRNAEREREKEREREREREKERERERKGGSTFR